MPQQDSIRQKFRSAFKVFELARLDTDLEQRFKDHQRRNFVFFMRSALLFGVVVYICMIIWSLIFSDSIYWEIVYANCGMITVFGTVLAVSFIRNFHMVAQYVGMVLILLLMINIVWIQAVVESNLEEGYGMLVTPGSQLSMIVFSGAEMGYGALLTPLLLLPIGFTAPQTFLISLLTLGAVNYAMSVSELPSAFVETSNSIFISIGIFSTLLSFLVNQQRRAAFQLSEDLKIARDKAEEASQAKSTFLATMSHEVRTPLNGILGMTGLLLETPLNKQQHNYLETVQYSGETLLAMLNDILDFSKMEAGKFEIEKLDTDLHKLLKSVLDLMRSRAAEKAIALNLEVDDKVYDIIYSDPTRLRQILLNLLSNALKFTDNGSVTLRVSIAGQRGDGSQETLFEIIDTGIGIPEKAQEKLFQEFSQADSSTSRQYGGTGLGLTICKKLVELLGGSIHVTSKEGAGSNFWFTIPLEEGKIDEKHNSAQEQAKIKIAPINILIVDDNEINRQIARDYLLKDGHDTKTAESGEEALKILETDKHFDLVLMDMEMPGMDGPETTRRIKDLPGHNAKVPVIALTANNLERDAQKCRNAGMIDVMTKPFKRTKLQQTLAKSLPEKIDDTQSGGDLASDKDAEESTDAPALEAHIEVALLDKDTFDELEEYFGDDYVVNFINESIDSLNECLQMMDKAVTDKDLKNITAGAHRIRGITGMCGLNHVYGLADTIEALGKQGEMDQAVQKTLDIRPVLKESLDALSATYNIKSYEHLEFEKYGLIETEAKA